MKKIKKRLCFRNFINSLKLIERIKFGMKMIKILIKSVNRLLDPKINVAYNLILKHFKIRKLHDFFIFSARVYLQGFCTRQALVHINCCRQSRHGLARKLAGSRMGGSNGDDTSGQTWLMPTGDAYWLSAASD